MKNVHEIEYEIKKDEWSKILDAAFEKKVKDVRISGGNVNLRQT